jgi:hypothetical protein
VQTRHLRDQRAMWRWARLPAARTSAAGVAENGAVSRRRRCRPRLCGPVAEEHQCLTRLAIEAGGRAPRLRPRLRTRRVPTGTPTESTALSPGDTNCYRHGRHSGVEGTTKRTALMWECSSAAATIQRP